MGAAVEVAGSACTDVVNEIDSKFDCLLARDSMLAHASAEREIRCIVVVAVLLLLLFG